MDDVVASIYYLASIGNGYGFINAKYAVHGFTNNLNITFDSATQKQVAKEFIEQLGLIVKETLNLFERS